jgi:hypothetical protein
LVPTPTLSIRRLRPPLNLQEKRNEFILPKSNKYLSTESVDFCVDNSKVNKKNKKGEK